MPHELPPYLPEGFSENDFWLIRTLREAGILVEMEPSELRANAGTVPVFCSDGDRFDDVYQHHREMCAGGNYPVRPHVIAYPGAPFLLSRHSPEILGVPISRVLIHGIRTGPELKKIQTVVLVHHWPCGMARKIGIKLLRSIELAFNGKQRLKRELAGTVHEVVACLQIDYGPDESGASNMKTYHVQKEKWLRWITSYHYGESYPTARYTNAMSI